MSRATARERITMAAGDKLTTEASVARVKAWKRRHAGHRPSFRDCKAYY
jgi:hypothetical protein